MEPIFTTAAVAGAVISGVLGNRADDAVCKLLEPATGRIQKHAERIRDRLNRGQAPLNHDLDRELYRAYHKATIAVCIGCMKSKGIKKPRFGGRAKDQKRRMRGFLREYINWLDSAIAYAERQLDELEDPEFAPQPTGAEEELSVFFTPTPKIDTGDERAANLKGILIEKVTEELQNDRAVGAIPFSHFSFDDDSIPQRLDFESHFDDEMKGKWFPLFSGFFVDAYKKDEKVRSVVQGMLLADLPTGKGIDAEAFEQQLTDWGKRVLEQLTAIDKKLDGLQEDVRATADEMRNRLDAFIPRFLNLAESALEKAVKQALRDVKLDRFYEKARGAYIAAQVEYRIDDLTHRFAGRFDVIDRLDAFLEKEPGGMLFLTAPAGAGKSALLANWIRAQSRHARNDLTQARRPRVVSHFFSNQKNTTQQIVEFYKHLLDQLYPLAALNEVTPGIEGDGRDALFALLNKWETTADEPLVIVIDGLDEAERAFDPPFPNPLPPHVYVILSARADAKERSANVDYLEPWTRYEWERLCLSPSLYEGDVYVWLLQSTEAALHEYAAREGFVRRLHETSEQGYPLYLSYLMQDLEKGARAGADLDEILDRQPKDFQEYIEKQFKKLQKHVNTIDRRQVAELFALLTVTHGPLEATDVQELTDLSLWDPLPWQATRWLTIVETPDTTLYSFAHPRLAQTFRQTRALRKLVEEMEKELLSYCREWSKHHSKYALRHLPTHLKRMAVHVELDDAGRYRQELYALAQNQEYAEAQRKALPEEPDLTLRAPRRALQVATEIGDAAAMAASILCHAYRVEASRQRSPLDHFRKGSLKAALQSADLYNPEKRLLHYLLIAWACADAGDLEEAERVLQRLQTIPLPSTKNLIATLALLHLVFAVPDEVIRIQKSLIDDSARRFICDHLFQVAEDKTGNSDPKVLAVGIVEDVGSYKERDRARVRIIRELSRRQRIEEALELVEEISDKALKEIALRIVAVALARHKRAEEALGLVEEIVDETRKKRAFRDIAVALAEQQHVEAALDVVRNASNDEWRDRMLHDVVVALCRAESIFENKEVALKIAYDIKDDYYRSTALSEIARAIRGQDVIEETEQILQDALSAAQNIVGNGHKSAAFSQVAEVLFYYDVEKSRQAVKKAQATAEKISGEYAKENALRRVSKTLAIQEDFDKALKVARTIDGSSQEWALHEIAVAAAKLQNFEKALEIASDMDDVIIRSLALREVASALYSKEHRSKAREVLKSALEAAESIDYGYYEPLSGYRNHASHEIAKMLVQPSFSEEARRLLDERLATSSPVIDAWYTDNTLRIMAVALAQKKRIDEALGVTRSINDEYHRDWARRDIVVVLVHHGRVDKALEILRSTCSDTYTDREWNFRLSEVAAALAREKYTEESLNFAKSISDDFQKSTALRDIAVVLAQSGDTDRAMQVARNIVRKENRNVALREIAIGLAKKQQVEEALKTIQEIDSELDVSRAKRGIAVELADQQRGEKALQLVQTIDDKGEALREIAEALARQGNVEKARHAVRGIENDYYKCSAICAITVATKNEEGVDRNLREAKDIAHSISDESDKRNGFIQVALALTQIQRVGEALNLVQEISEEKHRVRALREISLTLTGQGQFQEALGVVDRIGLDTDRSRTLKEIGQEAIALSGDLPTQLNAILSRLTNSVPDHISALIASAGVYQSRDALQILMLPAARHLTSAWAACGALVQLYPEQISELYSSLQPYMSRSG